MHSVISVLLVAALTTGAWGAPTVKHSQKVAFSQPSALVGATSPLHSLRGDWGPGTGQMSEIACLRQQSPNNQRSGDAGHIASVGLVV